MELERRYNQGAEIRAEEEDDRPVLRGYAVATGQMSHIIWGFREIIEPGAFAASLDKDVRALWQHNSDQVLGRTVAETLRLFEDDAGVGFELWPPDTQVGRDAVISIRRRDVDGMSFGFSVLPGGAEWEEEEDGELVRRVTAATLYEISPVTWPAYPQTSVDVRQQDIYGVMPEIPAELRARLGGENDPASQLRAQAARRMRILKLAE